MNTIVDATYVGFLQPLIWNIILSNMSLAKIVQCNGVGIWGLFWFDDDGEMMEKCLKTGLVGAKAEYYEAE
jgi:hypothetical protein|tara:strand:- start:337 stop:549 length:213 start_codon:yes stop_codon:yes gene_type:complete